ncbi:hypothetical protein C8Q72DRAFT_427313 [Fomitopsis betulina]|nr:hypothetical protein C8Q72DRAFT_427313 [Fomitopsis betulina]
MSPTAFLLVFSEPGPDVTEDEYHDWYDNEHIPLRATTPAFLNWTRWKAVDGEKPIYGASCDLESYEATKVPPYTTLAETRSDREKGILRRIQLLDRRHYEVVHTPILLSASYDPTKPAPFVVFISLTLEPEYESEFNTWYDEEHIPMLSKVPGWVRTRRFALKDLGQMGVEGLEQKETPKYLAVHEWQSLDGFQSEEYKAAMSTPWREKVQQGVVARERRVMTLLKMWTR